MGEIIPINSEQATNKEPFNIAVTPLAFPEPMQILMEWNPIEEKWSFEVRHTNINETVIQNLVTPYLAYWYRPYIMFSFIDQSGQETEVTPENLGDEVQLYAYPGPSGEETR